MRRSLSLVALGISACAWFALVDSCAEPSASDVDGGGRDAGADQRIPDLGHDGPSGDGGPSCDLGPVGDGGMQTLFVTATTTSGSAYAAERRDAAWSVVSAAGSGLTALVATQRLGHPFVIGRQTNDALVAATSSTCLDQLPAPVQLFAMALTAERPAPVGGNVIDLVFRGSISGDQRLFHTRYDGAWQAAKPLGNFLSILPPVAFRSEAQVHAIFTGTNGIVYDGVVDDNGGAASQLPGATSPHGPAALVSDGGVTYVVWTGDDTNLYYSTHVAGSGYAAPLSLCTGQSNCLIASDAAPVLAADASGTPTAAWIGKGDGIVYVSRYDIGSATWTAPVAGSTEPTALLPALAPGVDGSVLELVYVRANDGQGRHTRQLGTAFTSAVDLPGPKLGSRPSLLRLP